MFNIKKMVVVLFAVVLLTGILTASVGAEEIIKTDTHTHQGVSVLLIDRSGSMNDQEAVEAVLAKVDRTAFDAVVEFDHRLSAPSAEEFVGAGDSHICETIDKMVSGGFTHITVITDGEQWPRDYSSLGVYADVDITIYLVEDTEASSEFINQLESRLVKSNLKVVKPDGLVEDLLQEFEPHICEVEIPVPVIPEVEEIPEPESEETQEEVPQPTPENNRHDCTKGCGHLWLCILGFILGLLGILLGLLSLLRKRGGDEKKAESPSGSAVTPSESAVAPTMSDETIADIASKLRNGATECYLDCSGSMEAIFEQAGVAAQKGGVNVTCFGSDVTSRKPSEIAEMQSQGATHGWEALETTAGGRDAVIISDMHFNGKAFDINAFSGKHFRKIWLYAPAGYNQEKVSELSQISNEVEILPLK